MTNKVKTMNIVKFEKTIGEHRSFRNMGRILKLTGPNHAFMYKDELYRAYFFPNFGSQTIQFWKDKK